MYIVMEKKIENEEKKFRQTDGQWGIMQKKIN